MSVELKFSATDSLALLTDVRNFMHSSECGPGPGPGEGGDPSYEQMRELVSVANAAWQAALTDGSGNDPVHMAVGAIVNKLREWGDQHVFYWADEMFPVTEPTTTP